MMLLASISWVGLLVLVAGGWLILRLVNRRGGESRCGGMKLLGVAAIVAGIAVFWMRSDRHVVVDQVGPPEVSVFADHGQFDRFVDVRTNRDIWAGPADQHVDVDRWVFITLGSGLVILGALFFGRGGTRPVALKAVTLLGIGAIVYAVVTFLGQPPRQSRDHARMVRLVTRDIPRLTRHEDRTPERHSRAKRPSLRPMRPTGDEDQTLELPPRAGEIPVSAELARPASTSETAPKSTPVPAASPAPPAPASKPASAEQPQPTAAPADSQKPVEVLNPVATAASVAEPDAAKGPSAAAPASEASEPPAPPTPPAEAAKPAETPKPVDPEKPAEADKSAPPNSAEPVGPVGPAKPVEPANRVEPEPAGAESSFTVSEDPRPGWVDALPGLSGGVYSLAVNSGPFVSLPECQRELDQQMKLAADRYIDDYLPGEQASALVDIPLEYLKRRVKKAEYVEIVRSKTLLPLDLGPMYQIHARLEFDDEARADFSRQWHNAEVVNRLWYTGGAAALVLALLSTVYGYLKLDLRTGEAHKGRLQLAATLVALIAAAGVLLVRWAVPF